MTDQTAQEPTMEEILASIRRIISEDEAPAETAPVAAATEPEPAPAPVEDAPPPAPEEDVLELTDRFSPATIDSGVDDLHRDDLRRR